MQNFDAPTREDLHAYRVLINYLREVQSLLENINGETERSMQLLKEQKEMFEEQDSALQDLSSNLNNYAEDAEHRLGLVMALATKVSSEYLTAMAVHVDSQREETKFEQAAEAAEACNG